MVMRMRYNVKVFKLCLPCLHSTVALPQQKQYSGIRPITTYISASSKWRQWLALLTGSRTSYLAINIVRNNNAWSWNVLQSHNVHTKFHKSLSTVPSWNGATQTERTLYLSTLLLSFVCMERRL